MWCWLIRLARRSLATVVIVAGAASLSSRAAWAEEPCYGWTEPKQVEGEHLSVEWDDLIDRKQAERNLAVAESAWATYTEWGFPEPVGAPSVTFRTDILSRGGFTDTTTCDDLEHARMFVYEEAVQARRATETTVHELFHAVQYAFQPTSGYLGNYVIWPWWSEGTATWATMRFGDFSDTGDWPGAVNAHLALGHLALHQDALAQADPSRVQHLYGNVLLATYLESVGGGPQAVVDTFEAVVGQAGSPAWFPDVIEAIGLDWTTFWQGYLARLPTLDLPLEVSRVDRPPVLSRRTSLPGSYDPRRTKDPPLQSLGWAIHRFDAELGAPEAVLEVSVTVDPGPRWHALLVRTAGPRLGSPVQEQVVIEVGADGTGTAQIAFDGSEPVFLVVSPELDGSVEGYSHAWAAELLIDEVPSSGGCHHSGPISLVVGLLGGLLLRRRARLSPSPRGGA